MPIKKDSGEKWSGKKISEMSAAERFFAGCRNPRASPRQEKAIKLAIR